MCGIVGFSNFNGTMSYEESQKILYNMNKTLTRRGPDEDGLYIKKDICIGHKRLIVIDPAGGKQPMIYNYQGNDYVITYNGQIYNTDELKETLKANEFTLEGHCDTEILLKAFIYYGYDVVKHLNGIFSFAIWNERKQELFLARDHFGVKPLFYAMKNNELIFASEIKALLEFPSIFPTIDEKGISELFGIGPAHTPGLTVFKGIEELKPASFMIYNRSGIKIKKYWKMESKIHEDNFEITCGKVRYLLNDTIKKQLVSDVPLCIFLSGGLDSSIITAYAANYCKENKLPAVNTFSVNYKDNDKNFQKTDFQPNSDEEYINLISNKFKTNHNVIMLDTPELEEALRDAVIARDVPRNGRR